MVSFLPHYSYQIKESVPQVSGSASSHDFWWAFANQAAAFRCCVGIPFDDEVKHEDQIEGFVCARSGLTGGFLWTNVFIVCLLYSLHFKQNL